MASRAADFALARLRDAQGRWLRVWDGEKAHVPAFLDDHAALLCALLDLHRAGGTHAWLGVALELAEAIAARFFDTQKQELFFASGDDAALVYRPQSDGDGATPAASGLAVLGLVRIAALAGRSDLLAIADAVLARRAPVAARVPLAWPTLIRAGVLHDREPGLALVLGDPQAPATRALAIRARGLLAADEAVAIVHGMIPPPGLDPVWLEGRMGSDPPVAYLCRGRSCSLPARDPAHLALPPS
jgi:uncharacterized protein YyaL (SSP411 family)